MTVRDVNPSSRLGGGANAEEVWGTDVSQRGPGAEPLVGVWGLRPEAKGY